MNADRLAGEIYRAASSNAPFLAELDNRRLALALECADPAKRREVTSFSVGGQSGSLAVEMPRGRLLAVLNKVAAIVAAGGRHSTGLTQVGFQ